jgi:hypothetical protein
MCSAGEGVLDDIMDMSMYCCPICFVDFYDESVRKGNV